MTSPAQAEGGPPMVTDDPGTPGDGHWEINVAWTFERARGSTASDAPLVDANYGVGDRIQLKYEVPWIVINDSSAASRSGVGDSLIGVKWRFFDDGPSGWQISTYPQLSFRTSGEAQASGGVDDTGTLVIVPIEIERSFGWLSLNLDAGRVRIAHGADQSFVGLAAGHEIDERLEVMAEIHSERADHNDRMDALANVGVRWKLMDHGTLLVSLGRYLRDDFGTQRSAVGYVGWQFTL